MGSVLQTLGYVSTRDATAQQQLMQAGKLAVGDTKVHLAPDSVAADLTT